MNAFNPVRVATAVLGLLLTFPGGIRAEINVWTSHGPDGGMIRSLVVDPQDPDTVYAIEDTGALFKTADGGGAGRD